MHTDHIRKVYEKPAAKRERSFTLQISYLAVITISFYSTKANYVMITLRFKTTMKEWDRLQSFQMKLRVITGDSKS